jgi:cytochrome c553
MPRPGDRARHFHIEDAMTFRLIGTLCLAGAVGFALCGGALAAGDAKAGRKKAQQCQACHGIDGVSKLPDAPNLAGQNEVYLVKALHDYRMGARKNEVMSVMAPTLSNQDVLDLAAWYSSIPVDVKLPE